MKVNILLGNKESGKKEKIAVKIERLKKKAEKSLDKI